MSGDTLPTATRVSDPGLRALYRQENRWQAWLDVEAALARAQAQLGIIPAAAAEAIAAKSKLELMDRRKIDEGFARTGHTPWLHDSADAQINQSFQIFEVDVLRVDSGVGRAVVIITQRYTECRRAISVKLKCGCLASTPIH